METIQVNLLQTQADCDNVLQQLIETKRNLNHKLEGLSIKESSKLENSAEWQAELESLETEIEATQMYHDSLPANSPKRMDLIEDISASNHRKLKLTNRLTQSGPVFLFTQSMDRIRTESILTLVDAWLVAVQNHKASLAA